MGRRKLCLQYYLEYNQYLRRRLTIALLLCLVTMYWSLINTRKRKRAINSYAPIEDQSGDDSDTLPSPTVNAHVDNSSHSSTKKCPRGSKSPTKKPLKMKSRLAECTDEINATMKSILDTLTASAPPQVSQLADQHVSLWQRLEATPLTPDQKVLIGEHLSTNENKGKRDWLCNASDATLHAWVFKYLCDKEGFNL